MKKITLYQAGYTILKLPDLLDYNEPISALDKNSLNKLNTCIEQPFITFGNKYIYWYIFHRAAVMFYLIIKNHPLENGNKRSAVGVTLTFLYINNKWLDISPDVLYEIACDVASSSASDSENVIMNIKKIFKENIRSI